MGKINPKASTSPAPASASKGQSQKRGVVPKASALKPRLSEGTPRRRTQLDQPASAPIKVCIYKYTDNASVFDDRMGSGALFLLAVAHRQQRPTATWNVLKSFRDCLQRQAGGGGPLPSTLSQLIDEWHIRIQVKPKEDPDSVFDAGVVGVYIGGTLEDLLQGINKMDSFFACIQTNRGGEPAFKEP